MLAMVARSGTDSVSTPAPPYSRTRPTLPLVVSRFNSSRITSLAVTQGRSRPCRFTRTTCGQAKKKGPPAMATATSSPPAPIASMPTAPAVGVWLSLPRSVHPGRVRRSRCTWWQMPLPGFEKRTP